MHSSQLAIKRKLTIKNDQNPKHIVAKIPGSKIKLSLPNLAAAVLTLSVPKTVIISARAVMSSRARKNGEQPLSILIKITPADQISTAVTLQKGKSSN